MIPYVLSRVQRFLREALTPATVPRITLSRTLYLVQLNGTLHRVRRDRVCDCGGSPLSPCPAIPLVQDYLANGGSKPLGRHPDTWPATWLRVPPLCPVCDCHTTPDRHLDSRTGPGWRCSLEPIHFWQVRAEALRRRLKANPPPLCYPWYDTPEEARRTWLAARYHPPRLVSANPWAVVPPTKGDEPHAAFRSLPGEGGHWIGDAVPCQEPYQGFFAGIALILLRFHRKDDLCPHFKSTMPAAPPTAPAARAAPPG